MTDIEFNHLYTRLVYRIAKVIHNNKRKRGNIMEYKGITIRNLINTNKRVGKVILKARHQIFQEVFETDLGRYHTVKSANNETVLHECNIPLDTEVLEWHFDGTTTLCLLLSTKDLGVKPC